MNFDLNPNERHELWELLIVAAERYQSRVGSLPIAPALNPEEIRSFITAFASGKPDSLPEILEHVIEGMTKYAVHTANPGYFGLFNPKANFPGILADTLTAVFNPQLAAWSHAPFAAEVENYLLRYFGQKFGFKPDVISGTFTTGGAEANLTALLCALNFHFPAYAKQGLQGIPEKPLIYCSAESHHSIIKALRVAGLGSDAIRLIPVDENLQMKPEILDEQIIKDKRDGFYPVMVVATAGTTGAGAIDPLTAIAAITSLHNLWYHVDAAFGGALILSSSSGLLAGIEKADSITFDAHKWLSVPMGTSMLITSKPGILGQTFRITTAYMPNDAKGIDIEDPFVHSIQWSRRFNGLKLYLSLLMFGEDNYRKTIDHQISMGVLLKQYLEQNGWKIYNNTDLPVLCFGKAELEYDDESVNELVQRVIRNGKAWISVYPVNGIITIRASVTNYNTTETDLQMLVEELTAVIADISI
jgi:glutamate/tyrosine decarboxylase-like PLP-dependent enzyme